MAHDSNAGMTSLVLDGGPVHHVSTDPKQQYAARDAKFEVWFKTLDIPNNDARRPRLEAAFDAGWAAARKVVFGLDKSKAE